MKNLILVSLVFVLSSCSAWPEFFQAAEKIATDTAIKIEISEEVLTPETDCTVAIELINKTAKVK